MDESLENIVNKLVKGIVATTMFTTTLLAPAPIINAADTAQKYATVWQWNGSAGDLTILYSGQSGQAIRPFDTFDNSDCVSGGCMYVSDEIFEVNKTYENFLINFDSATGDESSPSNVMSILASQTDMDKPDTKGPQAIFLKTPSDYATTPNLFLDFYFYDKNGVTFVDQQGNINIVDQSSNYMTFTSLDFFEGPNHISIPSWDSLGNKSEIVIDAIGDFTDPKLTLNPYPMYSGEDTYLFTGTGYDVNLDDLTSNGNVTLTKNFLSSVDLEWSALATLYEGENYIPFTLKDLAGRTKTEYAHIIKRTGPPVIQVWDYRTITNDPNESIWYYIEEYVPFIAKVNGQVLNTDAMSYESYNPALKEGDNAITFTAQNFLNTGASYTAQPVTINMLLDTIEPIGNLDILQKGPEMILKVDYSDEKTKVGFELTDNGLPFYYHMPTTVSGKEYILHSLASGLDGNHTFELRIFDEAGNENYYSNTFDFRNDLEVVPDDQLNPTDPSTVLAKNYTSKNSVVVGWRSSTPSMLEIITENEYSSLEGFDWISVVDLQEGVNNINVTVNNNGDDITLVEKVISDTTPPTGSIDTENDGFLIKANFSFNDATSNVSYKLYHEFGGSEKLIRDIGTYNQLGNDSYKLPLSDNTPGLHKLRLELTDAVGNTSNFYSDFFLENNFHTIYAAEDTDNTVLVKADSSPYYDQPIRVHEYDLDFAVTSEFTPEIRGGMEGDYASVIGYLQNDKRIAVRIHNGVIDTTKELHTLGLFNPRNESSSSDSSSLDTGLVLMGYDPDQSDLCNPIGMSIDNSAYKWSCTANEYKTFISPTQTKTPLEHGWNHPIFATKQLKGTVSNVDISQVKSLIHPKIAIYALNSGDIISPTIGYDNFYVFDTVVSYNGRDIVNMAENNWNVSYGAADVSVTNEASPKVQLRNTDFTSSWRVGIDKEKADISDVHNFFVYAKQTDESKASNILNYQLQTRDKDWNWFTYSGTVTDNPYHFLNRSMFGTIKSPDWNNSQIVARLTTYSRYNVTGPNINGDADLSLRSADLSKYRKLNMVDADYDKDGDVDGQDLIFYSIDPNPNKPNDIIYYFGN